MTEIALSPLQVRVHDQKNCMLGINDLENAWTWVAGQFVPLAWARDKASLKADTKVTTPSSFGRTLSPISARI